MLAGGTALQTYYGDFVNAAGVLFFAFGVAYPVLRHRLVDLNILVSRATVFTLVSLIIVAIFIAAEWGIAKVFEQSFGLYHDGGGLAAQLITLVIVLMQLGVHTVTRSLAPLGVAYYLHRGDRYDRCADADAEKFLARMA